MQRLALPLVFLMIAGVILFFASMIFLGSGQPDAAPSPGEIDAALGRRAPVETVVAPSGLMIPVAGIRPGQLLDTFNPARAGGARVHDAIDIMAPRGTPVVAAAEGVVEKLYFSQGGGGITVYVRSPDRLWTYYYAHLDRYAPGLAEGNRVARGDPIGFVGSTGNANPAGPHLHFAIMRMAPGDRFYQGRAINPYPLLAGNARSR